MPFECSFSYIEIPFSAYLRTTDVTCTPFSYAADALISFISILMIVPIQVFMYYSTQLCCSWYPFDENPRAQGGIHCETVRWIIRVSSGLKVITFCFSSTSVIVCLCLPLALSLFCTNPLFENFPHLTPLSFVCQLFILFLPFVSQYITSVASASVLAICCWAFLRKHQERLPFHRMEFNLMRGGCIAAFFYCGAAFHPPWRINQGD